MRSKYDIEKEIEKNREELHNIHIVRDALIEIGAGREFVELYVDKFSTAIQRGKELEIEMSRAPDPSLSTVSIPHDGVPGKNTLVIECPLLRSIERVVFNGVEYPIKGLLARNIKFEVGVDVIPSLKISYISDLSKAKFKKDVFPPFYHGEAD